MLDHLIKRSAVSQKSFALSSRPFSSAMSRQKGLKIGYVPEHFSTPLYFAKEHFKLQADLIPFPSGTGHMVESLKSKEIDVGIGLTEGWVAGLGKNAGSGSAPYKMVGTFVESPLCWAISAGSKQDHMVNISSLKGKKIGVSRIGSGSYVMGFVLADQQGWLQKGTQPFENVVLNTFANLREGVNKGTADFFMWEHFTSKKYYDNGEIKRIGEIYTPWSSWKIVAREPTDDKLNDLAEKLNDGILYLKENQEEAIKYIYTNLDYSEADAREWMKTVTFPDNVRGVSPGEIQKTIDILGKAGVLDPQKLTVEDVVAAKREEKAAKA